MKISLLLIIAIFLFIRCTEKELDGNSRKQYEKQIKPDISENIFFENDTSIYTINKNNINLNKEEELFLETRTYNPIIDDMYYKVYKFSLVNDKYVCKYYIPKGTATVSLWPVTTRNRLLNLRINDVIVTTKSYTLNEGVFDNHLLLTQSEANWKKLIDSSLKMHPNYLGIYLSKWFSGASKKYIKKVNIENDISILKKNNIKKSDLKILEFVSAIFLSDSIKILSYKNENFKIKSYLLNNHSLSAMVFASIENAKFSKQVLEIINSKYIDLLSQNEKSFSSTSFILSGNYDNQSYDQNKVKKLIMSKVNMNEQSIYNFIAINHYAINHKLYEKNEISKIMSQAKNDFFSNSLLQNGRNDNLISNTYKTGVFFQILKYDYENGNLNYKKTLINFESKNPNEIYSAGWLYTKYKFYDYISKYDSASYYYLAYNYTIGRNIDINQLYNYFQKCNNKSDFQEWSMNLRSNWFEKRRKNAKKLREELEIVDYGNRKYNLNNRKLKILEFYSITCSPCMINIKTLNSIKNKLNKDLDIIYLCSDDYKKANEFLKKLGVEDLPAINSGSFIRLLGVDSYPYTLYLDRDNNIIKSESGGGNDMSKVALNFVNQYKNK